MSDDNLDKAYPETVEIYRRKEAHRKIEAKRSISEKMAAVVRLRDFERKLEDTRNKQGKESSKTDHDSDQDSLKNELNSQPTVLRGAELDYRWGGR